MKPRRVLQALHLGTELLGKVPNASDGILGTIVKLLAIADAAEKTLGRKTTVHQDIFDRYDLRSRTSEAFARLFFETKLSKRFKLSRHGAREHLELIEALGDDGERLFFQEYRWGRPEIASEFFYTPRFDFAKTLAVLWDEYPSGIYLSFRPARSGGLETTFAAVETPATSSRTTAATKRVERAIAAHRERRGAPWTLLAFGPPGTGKTQFALALGRELGARVLKIDAASMQHVGAAEADFLIDALAPTFLVLDDFEEAPLETMRARTRFLFEHLKSRGVSVVLTANDPKKLDPALLRSGRIDEAIEIGLPDAEERAELVAQLIQTFAPQLAADRREETTGEAAKMASATDGYNHADLAALVGLCRYEEPERALEGMSTLRRLAAEAEKKDDAPPKAPA